MQSRKDQVQAYFFVVGRLFAALTHGKPDILEPPNRRFNTGLVLGILLAGLLVGIFGIIGLISPGGSTAWQKPGAIIVAKDTGARYLFLDGRLRPVLNFTSARLAAGGGGSVVSVAAKSLAGVPVGAPIGIPGAPDPVPEAGRLESGPWTLCVGNTGSPTVTLMLGQAAGTPLTDSQGLLVSTSDGAQYVLANGKRYRLADATAIAGLGFSSASPISVPASWLNPIPTGKDITVPVIGTIGSAGPAINGQSTRVGQILQVRNLALNADQAFVVRSDGIAVLNSTTEALLLASPKTKQAYAGRTVAPIEVTQAALVGVPTSATSALDGYPSPLPQLLNASLSSATVPCARFSPSAHGDTGTALLTMPAQTVSATASSVGQHAAGTTIDQVSIPAGSGVLARALPTAGATTGSEFLVTDFGVKFPLADSSVVSTLGYQESAGVAVPSQLLSLLPTGPVLSAPAALAEQAPGA
jgi:type VII secretion protein EccB